MGFHDFRRSVPVRTAARRRLSGLIATAMFAGIFSLAVAGAPGALPAPRSGSRASVQSLDRSLFQAVVVQPLRWLSPGLASSRKSVAASFRPVSGETIPLFIAVNPSSITGGSGSVTVTVQVGQTGGNVQVGTTNPTALNSPSQSWPYTLSFPSGGSTTRTITVTTNQVSSSTGVTIYACPSGVDASNPANWSCSTTVTVNPVVGPNN
jgi:hypothetical protein